MEWAELWPRSVTQGVTGSGATALARTYGTTRRAVTGGDPPQGRAGGQALALAFPDIARKKSGLSQPAALPAKLPHCLACL